MNISFDEVKPYIDRMVAAEAKVKDIEHAYNTLKERTKSGTKIRNTLAAYFAAMDFILRKDGERDG